MRLFLLTINLIIFNISLQIKAQLVYTYPVATDQQTVFYIHQKSLTDLELWRLSVSDNDQNLEKYLYWRFLPIGFTLLPKNKGFSFADAGRLWVKDFIKRSPSCISFDSPVFNISEVCWLDETHCYFSAKQNQTYGIYLGDIKTGNLKILYDSPGADHLSPKILEKQLFCIERSDHDRNCSIIKIDLDNNYASKSCPQILVDCDYQQVVYLSMITQDLGFYIEHMPYIHNQSQMIALICHKLKYSDFGWEHTRLFKFNIPREYLFGEDRLYESIFPFLPRAQKTVLYFSDIKQNQVNQYQSSIFSYDLTSDKIIEILKSELDLIFFAPIFCNQKLFYGTIKNCKPDFNLELLLKNKLDLEKKDA